jgi:hypothetical protein
MTRSLPRYGQRVRFAATWREEFFEAPNREIIEACVATGRFELPPAERTRYTAFVDPSGGSSDSFTLAISHRDADGRAVLDALRERRPPFAPDAVVEEFAELLKSYSVAKITGDHYAGTWPVASFAKCGIKYEQNAAPKSDIYRDLLPQLNSGKIELLDHPRLIAQLVGLERRTSRAGKDSIDHPPNSHDDLANAVAGALVLATSARRNFARSARACEPTKRVAPKYVAARLSELKTREGIIQWIAS